MWPDLTYDEMLRIAFAKPVGSSTATITKCSASCGKDTEMFDKLPYRSVILGDTEFEFGGVDGNPLRPVCAVFKDLTTGQEWRLRRGEFGVARLLYRAGLSVRRLLRQRGDRLFPCASLANAGAHPRPVHRVQEFHQRIARRKQQADSRSRNISVSTPSARIQVQMIDLILRGPPWTEEEWQAILDYCAGDVYALERLLPAMLPYIDLPRALFRGRYMGNLAVVESFGVPVDVPVLTCAEHWTDIQDDLIAEIDADYGVFRRPHFQGRSL